MELSLETIKIFCIIYLILIFIGFWLTIRLYINIRDNPGPQGEQGIQGPSTK